MDFGIALDLDSNASARLTRAGLLLGTLLYTPPEWGMDDAWDAFSLGAVLFECLMGEKLSAYAEAGSGEARSCCSAKRSVTTRR